MPTSVAALTFTVAEPVTPWYVAVTLVVPPARGWTRPFVGAAVLTAAIAGDVDCHVDSPVRSWVELSL